MAKQRIVVGISGASGFQYGHTALRLLRQAADVALKERRRLVLMVRETPLNLAHLDNMRRVTEMGGIVFPPVPAFYHRPQSVDDILTHSVGRALELFGLEIPNLPHWGSHPNDD